MNKLLQDAFAKAAELPPEEQDALALRLLAELEAENDFDRVIASSAHQLTALAQEALEEHRDGRTEVFDPGRQ